MAEPRPSKPSDEQRKQAPSQEQLGPEHDQDSEAPRTAQPPKPEKEWKRQEGC